MADRTDEADHLSREGRKSEALEILRGVLEEDPGDAATNLSYARVLEGLGYERQAIPYLERAISGGLSGEEMEEATISLGSSYRAVGEPAEAVEILRRGLADFPENRTLRVFLAMSLHDLGEYREATAILLRASKESSHDTWTVHHRRAIDRYADELDAGSSSAVNTSAVTRRGSGELLRRSVRRRLLIRALLEYLPPPPVTVVDVGGGAGWIAVPLARRGYEVTILDPSEAALDRAREALGVEDAETARRVRLVRGLGEDAPRLLGESAFDAATCHGVLPFIEEPEPIVRALVRLVRPGGLISVLAKNADALAMRPALQGRYRKALESLDADRDEGPLGALTRADTVAGLQGILEAAGGEITGWYGVRSFTDHLGDAPATPGVLEDVVELEWEAGRKEPYRSVARWLHLLARRGPMS